jgi:hypothetical protein
MDPIKFFLSVALVTLFAPTLLVHAKWIRAATYPISNCTLPPGQSEPSQLNSFAEGNCVSASPNTSTISQCFNNSIVTFRYRGTETCQGAPSSNTTYAIDECLPVVGSQTLSRRYWCSDNLLDDNRQIVVSLQWFKGAECAAGNGSVDEYIMSPPSCILEQGTNNSFQYVCLNGVPHIKDCTDVPDCSCNTTANSSPLSRALKLEFDDFLLNSHLWSIFLASGCYSYGPYGAARKWDCQGGNFSAPQSPPTTPPTEYMAPPALQPLSGGDVPIQPSDVAPKSAPNSPPQGRVAAPVAGSSQTNGSPGTSFSLKSLIVCVGAAIIVAW